MSKVSRLLYALSLLVPLSAYASGGHEGLMCTGCHSIHDAKGEVIFAVPANKTDVNKTTNEAFSGVTALCLACHQQPERGGMGIKPVSSHTSHPYGILRVNAKVAAVPAELLRDGNFGCLSCHDPHPSNPNYKYLRVDTQGGAGMATFCAVCHPRKASAGEVRKVDFFDSMSESSVNKQEIPEAPKGKR